MSQPALRNLLEEAREVVVVGDVHGRGRFLRELLGLLGWERNRGRWSRPDGQKLLFLGDLIDRGDENEFAVDTVRDLVEAGHAVCLMGNHEYNALLFHTKDPSGEHPFLRKRSPKNIAQHKSVLDEFAGKEHLIDQMIDWFKGLPLAIECERFRAVHACWGEPDKLAHLEERDGAWFIGEGRLSEICKSQAPGYPTIQQVLKGPETDLPEGVSFMDKDGHTRTRARVKWWNSRARTWGEAVVLSPETKGLDPATPYDGEESYRYSSQDKPVFFGHYWKDCPIEPDAPNAACLDYSVGRGGPMVAYRFRGERVLTVENYVSTPVP